MDSRIGFVMCPAQVMTTKSSSFVCTNALLPKPTYAVSKCNKAGFGLRMQNQSLMSRKAVRKANMNVGPFHCTDTKGREWTFGGDMLEALNPNPDAAPIVMIHTSTGLGVNRTYWRPMFRKLQEPGSTYLADHEVYCFDWICTGDSQPKPDRVSEPFLIDDYAKQLEAFAKEITKNKNNKRIILLSQGAAEPSAIRFAAKYPDLIEKLIIATGLSSTYLDREQNSFKKNFAFAILKSPAGDAFWKSVVRWEYIEGFSRKNILVTEDAVNEWVGLALEGAQDPRVRFGVYSFIAGFLFGDYRKDLSNIKAPAAYLSGDRVPIPTTENKMKSARAPVPIAANEGTMREDRWKRIEWHQNNMRTLKMTEVIPGAGPEFSFEQPELALPVIDKVVRTL
eukprot:CAMPEP_0184692778 /NCGR_PEP_ID=MMETSP0313-20130426/1104_1 /TAXON_ID=2792 /ORGANISM="Porphyridium aerugineum, Strain SAG 1380-2" /LENGTH=393 /DNA_ID=CAMNT_0027150627 /DNA_START=131 /DNA_END=1312 /DNA_ORIENTATION=+